MTDKCKKQEFNKVDVGDIIDICEEDFHSHREYQIKVVGIKYNNSEKIVYGIDLTNGGYKNVGIEDFVSIYEKRNGREVA